MSRLFLLRPQLADERAATDDANDFLLRNGRWTTDYFDAITKRLTGWSGDELLDSLRGTVVTADLALRLAEADISGFRLSEVVYAARRNEEHKVVYTRLVPLGFVLIDENYHVQSWSGHDLCASPKSELVVTERAFEIIRDAKLANCEIKPLSGEV